MQYLLTQDRKYQRQNAAQNHHFSTFEHLRLLGQLLITSAKWINIRHKTAEQIRRGKPTQKRCWKQCEKVDEFAFACGPDHQCGNVTKGTPCAARIRRDHHIDSTGNEKSSIFTINRQ